MTIRTNAVSIGSAPRSERYSKFKMHIFNLETLYISFCHQTDAFFRYNDKMNKKTLTKFTLCIASLCLLNGCASLLAINFAEAGFHEDNGLGYDSPVHNTNDSCSVWGTCGGVSSCDLYGNC